MLIEHEKNSSNESFVIKDNESNVGELTYFITDNNEMVIVHTEVDKEYRGKDVGNQLVDRAVEYAKEKNLKVIPQCPFARAIIERKD